MQFELVPALPPGVKWTDVARATLSVYVTHVYAPGVLQVSGIQKNWNESTLADQNAPPLSNNPETGKAYATTPVTTSAKWVSFDVTELVRDWVDQSLANNGLALSAADGTTFVLLGSKESAPGNHAELEIVTAAHGEQGIPGPQGSPGAPGTPG